MPDKNPTETAEKAHEISQKIANQTPRKRDKDAPDQNVSGGLNQKSRTREDAAQRPHNDNFKRDHH